MTLTLAVVLQKRDDELKKNVNAVDHGRRATLSEEEANQVLVVRRENIVVEADNDDGTKSGAVTSSSA